MIWDRLRDALRRRTSREWCPWCRRPTEIIVRVKLVIDVMADADHRIKPVRDHVACKRCRLPPEDWSSE